MKKLLCILTSMLTALLFAQGTMLVDQQSFDLSTTVSGISIAGIVQSKTHAAPRRGMKKPLCTSTATLAAIHLLAQGTMLVDQQSFDLASSTMAITIVGIGQSFTPAFSSIDYIHFGVYDSQPGSMSYDNLRQDLLDGAMSGATCKRR